MYGIVYRYKAQHIFMYRTKNGRIENILVSCDICLYIHVVCIAICKFNYY